MHHLSFLSSQNAAYLLLAGSLPQRGSHHFYETSFDRFMLLDVIKVALRVPGL
jgi:hypothetical protein